MSGIWIALITLGGTVCAGLVSYLISRRGTSGRVETTEAATLWEESRAIRSELRSEATGLRERVSALEKEVRECHGESAELKARLKALESRSQ